MSVDWIKQEMESEALRDWVHRGAHPKAVTMPDGTFKYANESWCKRLGYTWFELQRMSWKEITPISADLAADEANVQALVDGDIEEYILQKPYMAKGGYTVEGTIHVMRFPRSGPIKYCLVDWIPMQSSSGELLHYAMQVMTSLTDAVDRNTSSTQMIRESLEQSAWVGRLVNKLMDVTEKYPKRATIGLVVFFLVVVGYTQGPETAERWLSIIGKWFGGSGQ